MTWSKVATTATNVSAYKVNFADGTEKIRIGIGTTYADLTPEDAGSFGGYLLTHAPDRGEGTEPPS